MDDAQANTLIRKGHEMERTLRGTSQLDDFSRTFKSQSRHISIPGTSGYYEIHNLKHGDTRELFLMFLGSK